jgi:hypothetical protein
MPFFSLPRLARLLRGGLAALALLRLGEAVAAPRPEPATAATSATAAPSPATAALQPASDPAFRLSYRSAFTGYTRHSDTAVGPWRAVNDTVQRAGGWRAYAREAAAPSPAASATGNAGGSK